MTVQIEQQYSLIVERESGSLPDSVVNDGIDCSRCRGRIRKSQCSRLSLYDRVTDWRRWFEVVTCLMASAVMLGKWAGQNECGECAVQPAASDSGTAVKTLNNNLAYTLQLFKVCLKYWVHIIAYHIVALSLVLCLQYFEMLIPTSTFIFVFCFD